MPKRLDVAIAILCREGRVLICRRKKDDSFGGYWEFPGGKLDEGETLRACVEREVREELGVRIRVVKELRPIVHHYSHAAVRLHPFIAEITDGELQALENSEMRWVRPKELRGYRFPAANAKFIPGIIRHLRSAEPGAPCQSEGRC